MTPIDYFRIPNGSSNDPDYDRNLPWRSIDNMKIVRKESILTVVAFSNVTSLDLQGRSLKFESYGEHK
jgi:hypothetical protein